MVGSMVPRRIAPRQLTLRPLLLALIALASSALLIPILMSAQTNAVRFEDASPSFRNNQAMGMVQDRYGFLWIIDPWRVYRYDGYTYAHLYGDGSFFRDQRQLKGIAGGKRGIICLFAHMNELLMYDVNRNTKQIVSLRRAGDVKDYRITCVTEDTGGHFWVGCREGDLLRIFPPDTAVHQVFGRNGAGAPADFSTIGAIAQDSMGNVWAARGRHLFRLRGAATPAQSFPLRCDTIRGLPSEEIAGLMTGRDGRLWICMKGGSAGWINPVTGVFSAVRSIPPAMTGLGPTSMAEDRNGAIWVSYKGGGICRWLPEDERWEPHLVLTDRRGMTHPENVACAVTDRTGILFVLTSSRGLLRYVPEPTGFHAFVPGEGPEPRLSGSDVTSALVDHAGALWVGRESGGLDCLEPGRSLFDRYVHDPRDAGSLSSNYVVCMCERRNGELWIGNAGGDINIFDRSSRTFRHPDPRPDWATPGSNTVTTIYEDRQGTMWVGHYRGLDTVDRASGRFSTVLRWPEETLGLAGSVSVIRQDSRGDMWIGTAGRGLLRMGASRSDTTWYRHNEGDAWSLPSNSVPAICEDRTGRLWVGTPAGLALFESASGRFQNHQRWFPRGVPSVETGLTDHMTLVGYMGIIEDRHGDLWMAVSGGGVARFDTEGRRFRFFGARDGIVVRGTRRGAFFTTERGVVYCGGTGGINWFDPDSVRSEPFIPPVAITHFRVWRDAKFVPPGDHASFALDYTENNLTFEFAMLDFQNPDWNRCAYMLEGWDREWMPAVRERRVNYSDIPPGAYTFRVRGLTSDGFTSESEASITLTVSPPFWRTWWFAGMAIATLGSVLYALHRNRLARVRETERLRLRIADDLHDDIGSELSGIALQADLIARSLPPESPARARLTNVGQTIRSAGENLRDVVWIVNPDLDSVPDLVTRMRSTAARMLVGHQYTFDSPAAGPSVSLSLEFKRHVLMMFKEMLNNVVRHARATNVRIEVTLQSPRFRLYVADNGAGFDSTSEAGGRGLASLRLRADAIGGVLTIESAPGSGTRVCLEADITRSGD